MRKIYLNKGRERSLERKHPWVFSGAINRLDKDIGEGEIVQVYSNNNQFLAIGYYQKSSISVRLFSFEDIVIDEDFFETKIRKAYDYRAKLNLIDDIDTNVYRLFYAEADGLPGLVIDYYDGHIVVQSHSKGIYLIRQLISNCLQKVYNGKLKTIFHKVDGALLKESNIIKTEYFLGNTPETTVKENGNLFLVNWEEGQKTGFFIDQRENRKLLSTYSKDKTILNTFCYTGGFSVYAAKSGAKLVHSVDSSKKAIEYTNKNIQTNNITNHTSYVQDTFDFIADKKDVYDLIILDPPAFAKHNDAKHNAVIGYKRLNAAALKIIKPGGVIFTFSCSQIIDKALFYNTITAAAIEAKRNVSILNYLTQPPDHPIAIFHPEGEYLKGLILYVE